MIRNEIIRNEIQEFLYGDKQHYINQYRNVMDEMIWFHKFFYNMNRIRQLSMQLVKIRICWDNRSNSSNS